jgi:YjbE family integral membrane protein
VSAFFDLTQIVLIDLSMAGDNALMVGMAVAALPVERRKKAMLAGIGAATILRIAMALFAVQLLQITGLMIAGGLLLMWVAWKMARELRHRHHVNQNPHQAGVAKRFSVAVWQIIIADVSMSLDNVLGVAGVARTNMTVLIVGLGLSVAIMALASTQIARLVARYPRVGYIGIGIVLYAALHMIWDGAQPILNPIHAFV